MFYKNYFYIPSHNGFVYIHDENEKYLIIGGCSSFVDDSRTNIFRYRIQIKDFVSLNPQILLYNSNNKHVFSNCVIDFLLFDSSVKAWRTIGDTKYSAIDGAVLITYNVKTFNGSYFPKPETPIVHGMKIKFNWGRVLKYQIYIGSEINGQVYLINIDTGVKFDNVCYKTLEEIEDKYGVDRIEVM